MLWIAGRAAVSFGQEPISVMVADLLFPVALAAAVWREIVAGRNVRNAPIAILISLFALANFSDHIGGLVPAWQGIGVRLALAVAAVMIALIGGRVTPSFTRNWMARLQLAPLPAPMDGLDRVALAVTVAAAIGWVAAPGSPFVGGGLAAAGLLLLIRLIRWRGYRALNEPIVLVLHLGYLWLAGALVLLGCSILEPAIVPQSAALHALTAGAVGTMTLAIMTRASRGHTGHSIVADGVTVAMYVLVTVGAALRIAAPFLPDLYLPLIATGGAAWSGAFALFAIAYGPMLMRGRPEAGA
jgi:uncharacterized protein involved in response to NO